MDGLLLALYQINQTIIVYKWYPQSKLQTAWCLIFTICPSMAHISQVQRSVQKFLKDHGRDGLALLPPNPAVPKNTVYSNGVSMSAWNGPSTFDMFDCYSLS